MVSDIWNRTIQIERKKTRCPHMGYSFRLTARVLLYAPSQRQDSTYHTSRGALAGTKNNAEQLHAEIDMDVLYIGISLLLGNLDVLL